MEDSLQKSIVRWVNTFAISRTCNTIRDLQDGVVLFEVLTEIVPHLCPTTAIKRDTGDNYLLKAANIKKILSVLNEFYTLEMGVTETELDYINANAIAKEASTSDIIKLVEMVLGAAVECENKKEYIENIMLLDETSQRDLMVIIERTIRRHQTLPAAVQAGAPMRGESDNSALELQLQKIKIERDELKGLYEELSLDHSSLASENANLRAEKQVLVETVKQYEKQLEEKEKESAIERKLAKESSQEGLLLSMAKHNRDFTEEQYHALQVELEDKESIIADLKKKADEFVKADKELRKLRDNMDIMKEKVASAAKTEEKFARLQSKLEELTELKAQYKALQEQSNSYMKKALDLEEEASKVPQLKAQLDDYKQNLASLKVQALSASGNHEQQIELMRLREANKLLEEENEHRKGEIATMEETIQQLNIEIDAKSHAHEVIPSPAHHAFVSLTDQLQPDIHERLARLERENERLKTQGGDPASAEKLLDLQNRLEDAAKLNESYEAKLQEMAGKLRSSEPGQVSAAAEQKISELTKASEQAQEEKKKLLAKIQALEEENKKYSEDLNVVLHKQGATAEGEEDLSIVADLKKKLRAAEQKIEGLIADKNRLEGYLRTAKTMIRELRQGKKNESTEAEAKIKKQYEEALQSLKNQLDENYHQVAQQKHIIQESKECAEREQKLLVSAFYDMGLKIARMQAPTQGQTGEKGEPQATSFLATLRSSRGHK